MATAGNRAVWQDASGVPGAVRSAPLPTHDELDDHKVLVKEPGTRLPVILGCDVAGTVEAVAPGSAAASRFRVGDRVFGFGANRGFQDYVVLEDKLMAKIPGDVTYREPVVLGLCIATSALFLFGEDYLRLDYPKLGLPKKGKSVLIRGGSSAVGSNAIQLVTAAGYDAIATCSRSNFDYVRSLGAVQVFDYKDPDVTERVAAELDKGECAGVFMAAGLKEGNAAAWKVAAASKQTLKFASSCYIDDLGEVPKGVDIKQLQPGSFKPFPDCWFETIDATFGGYLPEAPAKGAYKEAVDLQRLIAEKGHEGVKEAINRARGNMKEDREASPVKLVIERP
ncbi:hypothetical protein VTG60DRAFT_6418 [Thermothelomyces hinnuleus]